MNVRGNSIWRKRGVTRLLIAAASLAGGALAFLALAARMERFWFLSRWPRMLLLAVGGAFCGLIFFLFLATAVRRLASAPRAPKLVWLAAAFGAAMLVPRALGWSAPTMPQLYVLEMTGSGPVAFLEMRGPDNRVVPAVDLQMDDNWQRNQAGWQVVGEQPAKLRYSFYAAPTGTIHLLFGENPRGGEVVLQFNGKDQRVDLSGTANGQRLVDLPFQKHSRWETALSLADLTLTGLAFPLFLFVVPFYALDGWRWARPRLRGVSRTAAQRFDYQKGFIVVFLCLLLLPFVNFKGDWTTIDHFFGTDNPFWPAYSWVRRQVFGDLFFGDVLIGKGEWLNMTSDHSTDDYQNVIPFTDEDLFQVQQRIDATTQYLKAQGITFLVVIPPNKATIYPENVPPQIQVIGKQSRFDQLLDYEKRTGKPQILDMRPALRQARQEQPVFQRTDTHWSSFGAYIGYVQVMDALQKDFPALQPHPLSDYRNVLDGYKRGDLGTYWVQSTPKEAYTTLQPVFDRQVMRMEMNLDKVIYTYTYNKPDATGLPSAVIYHDSFMDWLKYFLSDHFSRAVYVHSPEMSLDFIAREKPNIVIFEVTERSLDDLLLLPNPSVTEAK